MLVSYMPLATSDGYERRFDPRLPPGSVARSGRPGPPRAGLPLVYLVPGGHFPRAVRASAINTMLRTQCAHCAAPNAHTKCGICKTRYCGRDCQKLHWKDGHKELCPVIKRRGGPEVIYAEKKNEEAVAVAAEKCAEDTKGQTCYICTEALHWKTKEGLVRMCACRGTAGFAHVSCLAEQAKILFAEAEENNLGEKAVSEGWARWYTCGLCKQEYHGVVRCALGWACWRTYLGRSEAHPVRGLAMGQLGAGLSAARQHEDGLAVQEAELALMRRIGTSEHNMLIAQSNLAATYARLGRKEEALRLRQDVYSGRLELNGEEDEETLIAAINCAASLGELERFGEAKSLLRKTMPLARRVLGENHDFTLSMKETYAMALYRNTGATLDDISEAVTTFEEVERIARQMLGGSHPYTEGIAGDLREARAALRARETPSASA